MSKTDTNVSQELKKIAWMTEEQQDFKADLLAAVNDVIISTDENGMINYWNAIAQRTYGLNEQQALGRNYEELITILKPRFPHKKVIDELKHSGASMFEVCFEGSDGKLMYHEFRSKIVRDKHGHFAGTLSTGRDSTERKESDATINRQNTILKAINRVYKAAMDCDTMQALGEACLKIAELIMESEIGFIGEVGEDGFYHSLANKGQRNKEEINQHTSTHKDIFKIHTKWLDAASIADMNDILDQMPAGHPKVNSFLGVPYIRGGRVIGMIGVANRIGGYTKEHKKILKAIAPPILETLLRKRAEDKVRENELLMRTIMDSASDFLFLKDRESRVVLVNQAYGKAFNVDINDVIGKNDYELYNDPQGALQVIENDKRVMETGETMICQESAKTVDGVKTYSLSKVPWRNASGQTVGVLGIAHDITELKQAKDTLLNTVASLGHSKEYIEILYEVSGKILSSVSPCKDIPKLCKKVMRFLNCDCFFNYLYKEGEEFLHLNSCYGIPSDSVKGLKTLPCGAAVCGYAVQNKCRVVAENIQFQYDEKTVELKSMGIRAYACHPLMADGYVLGSLAFGTHAKDRFKQEDLKLMKAVAESVAVSLRRKRTEETLLKQAKELERKNKLVTDYFINLSHEFKTPISILKLATELMEHHVQADEMHKDALLRHLVMIKSNANRLTRLVGNLLDMTKVDAGFMSPKPVCFDIVAYLKNMVQSIVLFASKRHLTISFHSNKASQLIHTDSEFIERIVLNLVSNAIKNTPKDGRICVSFKDCAGKVIIAVKDTGDGIPDDKKDIIFDRFRQANTTLSRSSEGCGIGLALTKSLVELLGGRIWFVSAINKGSEFFVELPASSGCKTNQNISEQPDNIENSIMLELSDITFD